jgi:PAS domain S-box-containing protein
MPNLSEKLSVLLIDDDNADYILIEEYLKKEFTYPEIYHVNTFSQAKDFLIQHADIQIILLNISLPETEGEDLINGMLHIAGHIPLIVLTACADKSFGIQAMSLGVADYLFKNELTGIQLYKSVVHSIERNRIHVKLNESEEKYKSLFNLSPLPQWVYDVETLQFLDVNEAAIFHYGYSREEFMSLTIKDIRLSKDTEMLQEIIDSKVKQGIFNKSIVQHKKKNGELIIVKVKGNSINFGNRKARLVLAVDITDSVEAQNALKVSELRFKALAQEGGDLIGILDKNGLYKYISSSTETILGIKPEQLIGKVAFNYVHEDDIEKVLSEFKALGTRRRIELSPFRFRDGNNRYRWIDSVITDMTDDPNIAGIVTNSRDITSRIESENRMRESIERYAMVSKATSDIIYEWDFSTNRIIWNKGIKAIFGYKNISNTRLEWWYNHVHPEDVELIANSVQESISKKKKKWNGRYRFRSVNGEYKYVFDRSFIIYYKGKPIKMIGVVQDITEPVKYIQEIEAQNTKLKEIAWTQSHMVRAPLARILGLIDILKTHPNQQENLSELLEYIILSAREFDEIISSIVNRANDSKQK